MKGSKNILYFSRSVIMAFIAFLLYYIFIDFLSAGPVNLTNKIVCSNNFQGMVKVTNIPGIKSLVINKRITNFYTNSVSNKSLGLYIITNEFAEDCFTVYIIEYRGGGVKEKYSVLNREAYSAFILTNYFEVFDFPEIYTASNIVGGKTSVTMDISFMDTNQMVGVHNIEVSVTNFLGGDYNVKTNHVYVVDKLPPIFRSITHLIRKVMKAVETYANYHSSYELVEMDNVYSFDVDDIGTGTFNNNVSLIKWTYETYVTNSNIQVIPNGPVIVTITVITNTNVDTRSYVSPFIVGSNVIDIWVILKDHSGNVVTNKIK